MNKIEKISNSKKRWDIMKKLKEHYKIFFIIIVLLAGFFLIWGNGSDNITLDEVRLKDTKNSMFAFMLENEDGKYIKSEDNMWPTKGYKYNQTLSGCIDGNNKEVKDVLQYNEESKKISVKTNSTIYCYLYFDKSSTGDKLLDEKTHGLNLTPVGDMYRFIGTASDEPNNYICFGKRGKCTLDSDYMYRIIGIEEKTGRLKLIKNKAIFNKQWHNNYTSNVKWDSSAPSDLYTDLNGTGFLTNTNTYVPSGWESKISTTTWNIGDSKWDNGNGYGKNYTEIGSQVLTWEKKATSSTPTKIGLMYLSDYYYSLDGTGSLNCFDNSTDYAKCKTSWLHISNSGITDQTGQVEWTMTRLGNYSGIYSVWFVHLNGNVNWNALHTTTNAIRPVFYLTAEQQIMDGEGTKENPFILDTGDIPLTESEQFIQDKLGNIPDNLLESNKGDLKYRFVGTQEEDTNGKINNYLCFGKDKCSGVTDEHMYRIIGITSDGKIKIQKNSSIGESQWWTDLNTDKSWEESIIFTESLKNFYEDSPNIILEMKNRIENHTWNTGKVGSGEYSVGTLVYNAEAEINNHVSKYGLAYLSDYYFAYKDGEGTENCQNYSPYCLSWMIPTDTANLWSGKPYEWTMTSKGEYSNGSYTGWCASPAGDLHWASLSNSHAIRPVFYLTKESKIKSGSGTSEDPYILESPEETGTRLAQEKFNGQIPSGFNTTPVGDLYRFVGACNALNKGCNNKVDNFICFGSENCNEGLEDDHMYRIIGIDTNGRLKLIRNVGRSDIKSWHTSIVEDAIWDITNNGKTSWLYNNLNGTDFLNNDTYFSKEWKEKISLTNWYIGDSNGDIAKTGNEILEWEDNKTSISASKIGLMYLSDFYYSLDGIGNTNCRSGGTSSYNACKSSWLHINNNGENITGDSNEWTIVRFGQYNRGEYSVWYLNPDGQPGWNNQNYTYAVRPVFYLTPETTISSGSGKVDDPFIINISE